ncbi:DUF1294 domain-containing protein [Persicirhabdus sediminis]|uniref:Cold shock and DUF1294 domain-containing protein n=1 Tax=Persicirhabdus sediminis TaxID=454144 RepID=A0A8J7MBT4_9BACT|nr:cold shock and DUF1294 domain-containing protein [Persicirhabdus sediminis]MBK1790212.1 cold shock and DUF1294 domain-containing protein [Persicirhabdus sediminis]
MIQKGTITQWNDDRGFGFITTPSNSERVFVHIKAFKNRQQRPKQGDELTYLLSSDAKGRPCAKDAKLCSRSSTSSYTRGNSTFTDTFVTLFFITLLLAGWRSHIPWWVSGLYLGMSVITFLSYRKDKLAAKQGKRRTPEQTLHILSLAGGWPGALIAQTQIRHKSKKVSFRCVFWLTLILNLAILWASIGDNASSIIEIITSVVDQKLTNTTTVENLPQLDGDAFYIRPLN